MRYPSCLISWSHSSPAGGSSTTIARASGCVRGSGPRTAPWRSASRIRAPPSPSAGPPGSTRPPGWTTFECQRRSRSAATSARPRPVTTLSGRALTMSSSSAGRACSSLSFTSSQAFGSSFSRTSAQRPASFSPLSTNFSSPFLSPAAVS